MHHPLNSLLCQLYTPSFLSLSNPDISTLLHNTSTHTRDLVP
jgi:hypothetical protein